MKDNTSKQGYIKRPLPLLIINIGYFIMPLFYTAQILFFYITARLAGTGKIATQYGILIENILVLIVATTLVGISLYWMNKLSWAMVILHSGLMVGHNVLMLISSFILKTADPVSVISNGLFQLVTIAIIVYFILIRKQFREIFFNQRLRWWESKTRYHIDSNAELIFNDGSKSDVPIGDISIGGICAFKNNNSINLQDLMEIRFSHSGKQFSSPVKIIWESNDRFGVKFTNFDRSQKRTLKKIITQLHKEEQHKKGR